jgi:AcrR family transcriptional regulator
VLLVPGVARSILEVSERTLMMRTKRSANRKTEFLDAAIGLGARGGPAAITIRAIAREVGVTDAAVYRHYRSKDELLCHAYGLIIDRMIEEKQHLATSSAPLREKLREWARLSYAYFDRDAEAYLFALATPHVAPQSERVATTGHGGLFRKLYEQARAAGEARPISPALAMSLFSGLILSIPRMIHEGVLEGPASAYVDDVTYAAWRVLRPNCA